MDKRQLGGYGFIIGNGALFANGLIAHLHANTPESKKAGIGRMGSAVAWGMSGVMLARYGEQPVPAQLTHLQEKLAAFMQQEGVPLDAEQLKNANAETHRGWFDKLEQFLYQYPIEITNAYTSLTAIGMAASGFLRRRDGNIQAGNANLGMSALILAGTLASILVPEKTPEQIKADGHEGTLLGRLEAKPLNLVRWLFLAGDVLSAQESLGEYRAASKLPKGDAYRPWQFGMAALSAFAMASFVAGDWITGAGSKKMSGTPEEREAAREQLLASAALMLATQPVQMQHALARKAAEYLVKQPGLRLVDCSPEQLATAMMQRVEQQAARQNAGSFGAHTAKLQQQPAASSEHVR